MDLEKWWEEFQNTLSQEGYGLDLLHSKSDCARLTILSYDAEDTNINDALDCKESLAFMEDGAEIDGLSDEEIMDKIHPGKPDKATLEKLYEASVKGTLFVRPPEGLRFGPQQVVTRKNGKCEILPDQATMGGNDKNGNPNHYGVLEEKIQTAGLKPKFPGIFTYIKYWFGNSSAKIAVTQYRALKADYDKARTDLKKEDKDDIRFTEAAFRGNTNYFTSNDADVGDRLDRMTKLLRDSKLEEKEPGVLTHYQEAKKSMSQNYNILMKEGSALKDEERTNVRTDNTFSLSGWYHTSDPVKKEYFHDKLSDIFAKYVVLKRAETNLDTSYGMTTITKSSAEKCAKLADMNSDEFKSEVEAVKKNPYHEKFLNNLTGGVIRDLAASPSSVYGTYTSYINKEMEKDNLKEISDAVKENPDQENSLEENEASRTENLEIAK